MRFRTRNLSTVLTASLLAMAVVGCNAPQPRPETPDVKTADPQAAAPLDDRTETAGYRIAITYPRLRADETPLADALRVAAAGAKRDLMQAAAEARKVPALADRQLELLIDFAPPARVPGFTSVRGSGMEDVGGAHPIPLQYTFVYDARGQRLVALGDLFTDPAAALRVLAAAARDALVQRLVTDAPQDPNGSPQALGEWRARMRRMIDQGTAPVADNFGHFLLMPGPGGHAAGITLVFPPYQVAPYVNGTQMVEVPAARFRDLLKPDYRDAFSR